jgi:hypothetical protein
MAIAIRNKDGSLSYKQTADEVKSNEDRQNMKQMARLIKQLVERVEKLEAEIRIFKSNNACTEDK